jgi:hypothetical protein
MYNKNLQHLLASVGHLTSKHKVLGPTIKFSPHCTFQTNNVIEKESTETSPLFTRNIILLFAFSNNLNISALS